MPQLDQHTKSSGSWQHSWVCWRQESTHSVCSSDHQRCDCGESEQHQVLGVDLSWTNSTTTLAKKAQQHLYFLHKLRRARALAPIMCTVYRGILTSCITVWVWCLQCVLLQDRPMHTESSWEYCWCHSPLPPGHPPDTLVCCHQGRYYGVSRPGPAD